MSQLHANMDLGDVGTPNEFKILFTFHADTQPGEPLRNVFLLILE